jgi:hypothetical protein
MQLQDIARVIRSKNAGPLKLTLDLMFENAADFDRVVAQKDQFRAEVARRYRVAPEEVVVIDYPPANAIKIVMQRAVMSGDPGDRDVYGAQQHTPLLEIEL